MRVEILLPRFGKEMEKATISRWLKNDGDFVSIGEPLVELTIWKATIELTAEQSGVLTILRQPGGVVVVGDTLGSIYVEQLPPAPILGPIHARLVKARPLRRVIRLSGALEATVEYAGWGMGYESAVINGIEAVRVESSAQFGHGLGFEIPSPSGNVRAWLEVSIDMLKLSVRLTVAGQVVWSEGVFGLVGGQTSRAELPIPTSQAADSGIGLPGSSAPPDHGLDGGC